MNIVSWSHNKLQQSSPTYFEENIRGIYEEKKGKKHFLLYLGLSWALVNEIRSNPHD